MGRINKTNKANPVSADEFVIYDSEDTTDDKNITLGQIATFTETQDSTVAGDKTFSGGCAFGSGLITYGQYTPFPTGYGAYVASYVSPTYGARLLGYNGSTYQDLSIGSMPTAGTVSIKSLANGDCNFGYNVNIAEDLGVTGDVTANKFIGDGSELTGTNKISFALNSGQVDASGNADLLAGTTSTTLSFKVDDGTTYKPLQVTYADGSQEVLTSLTSITGLSTNGSYEVLKIKGQNPITVATSAQFSVTQGKTFPVAPVDGDYHCLTAIGLQTYKRVSGEWVETQYVPIGTATVAGNVISAVTTNRYNVNGYDLNANNTKLNTFQKTIFNGTPSTTWVEFDISDVIPNDKTVFVLIAAQFSTTYAGLNTLVGASSLISESNAIFIAVTNTGGGTALIPTNNGKLKFINTLWSGAVQNLLLKAYGYIQIGG